jgi:hypothetical protein
MAQPVPSRCAKLVVGHRLSPGREAVLIILDPLQE